MGEQDEENDSASATSKDFGESMNSEGIVAAKQEQVDDEGEGDDQEEERQKEALLRATTRLLSKRCLISKLVENEEDIENILSQEEQEILSQEEQEILSQEEQDEEGGFVEIDEKEAKDESNNNDTNQEEEKEEEEKLNPSIFTSLG